MRANNHNTLLNIDDSIVIFSDPTVTIQADQKSQAHCNPESLNFRLKRLALSSDKDEASVDIEKSEDLTEFQKKIFVINKDKQA